MKRCVRFAALAAALVLALSGCKGKTEKAETEPVPQTTEAVSMDPGTVTKLGPYKGIELTKMSTAVTEEELDDRILSILQANPTYEEVDRPAEEGDVVNIDYVGFLDGEEFDGGSDENYDLRIGYANFIDGFEDGLIGTVAGETRELALTFPDNYYEDLAGKDVIFRVTVNAVKEVIVPEFDEDFVHEMSDFATVDEFREDLAASIEEEKEAQAESQLWYDAIQAVVDASEFDLNEEAIERAVQNQLSTDDYYANGLYGMTLDNFLLSFYGVTLAEYEDTLRELLDENVRQSLVVDAIGEKENLTPTDEDYETAATVLQSDVETLRESNPDQLTGQAMVYRVVNYILENAKITEE